MRMTTKLGGMVCTALLLLGYDSPTRADATRPNDASINSWVESALRQDPWGDASGIEASTTDGIVTLRGEVRDLAAKKFAELEAKKIAGVRAVIDELSVTPTSRFDGVISEDVRARLLDSPGGDLHRLKLSVTDGIVSLDGKVDSWSERREASLLASEVRGVRKVENHLEIDYTTHRPDWEIREDVISSIKRDVYLLRYPLDVVVKSSAVIVSGTVGSAYEKERVADDAWMVANVTAVDNHVRVDPWEDMGTRKKGPLPQDVDIARAVVDAVQQDLRIVDPYRIDATCEAGYVTLRGTVPTFHQKVVAERDARDVVGVAGVANELVVKSAHRTDDRIRGEIDSRFDTDSLIQGEDIEVRVNHGVVTLSGIVPTSYERGHAFEIAARIPGVLSVVDDLEVSGRLILTDAQLGRRIRDRLIEHSLTRPVADRIEVNVDNGVVTLTGDVDTSVERREAGRVALLTDGVNAVDDQLTVEGVEHSSNGLLYPSESLTYEDLLASR